MVEWISEEMAAMKVSDLELGIVEAPRGEGRPSVRAVLVCLTTDSGLEGWGEAPLRWRTAELEERRSALWGALASRSVFDVEEMLELDVVRGQRLGSALEMASWDLIGRAAGEPLCHLWGGAYRRRVPLAVRLPTRSASDLPSIARELAEQGFHSQIVTGEGRAESDAAAAAEAAEAAGERAEVQLDGAGRYTAAGAQRLGDQLDEDRVALLLDPLASSDLAATASLARQINIPLGLAASIRSPRDVMAAVRSGAAAHVVIDLHRVGGLLAARRCAAVAEAGGLSVSLAAEDSVGVALAAMLHTAAATPALASGNRSGHYDLSNDILADGVEIAHGMAAVPQAPGLGVQVDREKLERWQAP